MAPTNSDMIWGESIMTSKCNDNMRRRFNDEQIKSLENMFETESRPGLRTKQQLAKRLGLQPRQVAIWFQNKRARSKSKQLELEYRMLQISYDNLGSKYELLKKEHESLLIQLQRLKKLMEKDDNEKDVTKKSETEVKQDDFAPEFGSRGIDYLGAESDILDMAQIADGLTEIENEFNFESRTFLHDTGCGNFSVETLLSVTQSFCQPKMNDE